MFSFSTDNYHNSFASFFKHFNDNGLFNERQRRITAGLFALGLGEKGIKFISDMSGLDQRTIQSGIAEIKSGQIVREDGRIRAEGAGRPDFLNYQPDLLDKIQEICDKSTYGSPEGDILYKNMSLRGIADELKKEGIQINKDTVGKYLEEIRYSKQQNQKLLQVGEPHPQRDEILDQVFKTKMEFEENNLPCLSIDAKNKINKGNFSNPGQEYLPEQCPRPTEDHDFPTEGKIIPYGGFIPNLNRGMIILNESRDTAQLAVSSLRVFYEDLVIPHFGYVRDILVICDGGGSNGRRVKLFKYELALMADDLGISIHVCHLPPGESKFNMIEHKMFNHVSRNYAAKPIISSEVAKKYIENTTTKKGLKIKCEIDNNVYQTGVKISKEMFDSIDIEYTGQVHGFSYIIRGFKDSNN